ncbi:MAG: hypothetical protein JO297_18455 [Nitrososphaeraceae archaeon]|nr:hypothetical protein [Nitrososphaeraceae archaeon]
MEQIPHFSVMILSNLISSLLVFLIFLTVNLLIRGYNMRFGDIIRDIGGFPSLARFQFLLWTSIVMFTLLGVYFIRLLMGSMMFPTAIPVNLLIILGISVAVPIISNPISSIKYGDRRPVGQMLNDSNRRRLSTMLMENEKPSLFRFQMFAWTIISIIVFLGYFFSTTTFINDINKLGVPDVPDIFVYIIGISQVAYIAGKATTAKSLAVLTIVPPRAPIGGDVMILGANFGSTRGRVFLKMETNTQLETK